MLVCEIVGDQTVDAYSNVGRIIALYVCVSVSFCCPQLVEVSALRMLSFLSALSQVSFMCSVKVCCVLKVTPRILLVLVVGMC